MKARVLVLGSGGMAGHVVTLSLQSYPNKFEVIDVSRGENTIRPKILLDVSDFKKLESVYSKYKPNVIINCVGILNETAESNPDYAILMNSYLPHFLESLTQKSDCRVFHISTDCVFSGIKGNYEESDHKDGQGFYAQSKALGEITNNKDLTIRTSIIGPELKLGGIGLFHWFAQQVGEINGYTHAFWSGVTTVELGKAIIVAIEQNLTGVYHLVNNEKISKFDLLNLLKNEFTSPVKKLVPSSNYRVDKSLLNTRNDFEYTVPPYKNMVNELKKWIKDHQDLYPHYHHLLGS